MKKKNIFIPIVLSSLLTLGVGMSLSKVDFKKVSADTSYEGNVTRISSVNDAKLDLHNDTESEIRAYYNDLNSLSVSERKGINLLKHLKPILQNNTYFTSYENVRSWLMVTDRDWIQSPWDENTKYTYPGSEAKMHVLYRTDNGETTAASYTGTHADGTPGAKLNREHTWAKSRGFKSKYETSAPGTDLHHLILADTNINSTSHSNYPYGDSQTEGIGSVNKTTDTYNTYGIGYRWINSGKTWFEPQDQDKGDIARALLYMVARYNRLGGETLVENNGVLTSEANLTLTNMSASTWSNSTVESNNSTVVNYGDLDTLLRWNKLDPVSDFEIHRNNLIDNNYQHNRNPFIDYPEWVDYIWGNSEGYAQPNTDTISQYGHTCMTITGSNQVALANNETYDTEITGVTGSNTILWESSDTSVATINSSGVLTPVGVGTTTIKAITKDSTFYAEKEVEITESTAVHVTGVTLNKESTSILEGQSETLTATIAPNNADNTNVSWTSSDTSVATVTNGVISSHNPGTANITVTTEDGGFTDVCEVTVTAKTLSASGPFTLSFSNNASDSTSPIAAAAFLNNDKISENTLVREITYADKAYKGTAGLKLGANGSIGKFSGTLYTNARNNIKSISIQSAQYGSDTGKLKLTINGSTEISSNITPGSDFKYEFTNTTNITDFTIETTAKRAYLSSISFGLEEDVAATGVQLNKASLSLIEGDNETLIATVSPGDATNKNVTWSSDNEAVATVDDGVVTAVREGTTTVTVTTVDGGHTATCNIAVEKNSIRIACEACADLSNGSTSSESYTVDGTITGIIGRSFFIQKREYALYVYNGASAFNPSTIKVGDVVEITGLLANYNNQLEMKSLSAAQILNEESEQINPTVITALSDFNSINQNTIVSMSGLVYKSGSYTKNSNSSIVFKLNSEEDITYRTNSYLDDDEEVLIKAKIDASKATGTTVNLVGVHYVVYNSDIQINIYSADQIIVNESGKTDKQLVQQFVDSYMHMDDYDSGRTGVGDNSCLGLDGYYMKAKRALTIMTSSQITIFRTDNDFSLAKARYEAWAEAYGDTTPYEISVNASNQLSITKKGSIPHVIVVMTAVLTTSLLFFALIVKKKKEQ